VTSEIEFLNLQKGIVYGPIFSRRLGRDLGINLLSSKMKVCNFDCVYCQYGPSNFQESQCSNASFFNCESILKAISSYIKKPFSLDHITISGNGEPTLHPDFSQIVNELIKLRDRYKPGVPIALLTNGSRLNRPDVIKAVHVIDKPIFKLDAGNPEKFKQINRSESSVNFSTLIASYLRSDSIILQTALFKGKLSNTSEHEIASLARTIALISPKEVQLYTIERAYDPAFITPLSLDELDKFANHLADLTGSKITTYAY